MNTRIRLALLAALLAMPAVRPLAAQQATASDAAAAWGAGEHARARELYAQRLAADSADVQALHRLGLLLAWDRQYGAAIPLLERLVRQAPSAAARADLARVLSWAGRFDAADAAYRAMMAEDPGSAEALIGLARVTSWRGDLAAGEALWRRVVEARPDDADGHMGLSQVLRWRGQPRAALEHAEAAARLRPADREITEQLAWAEAAFAPRVAPTFSAEIDSDDNRLYTGAVAGSAYVSRRVALTLNGYVRRGEGPAPAAVGEAQRQTRSVSGGARVELGTGWLVSGAGGVTDRAAGSGDSPGGSAVAVWRGGLVAPAWLPVTGSASVARSALDATADLMGRDITTDEAALSLAVQLVPSLRLEGGTTLTRFNGERTNDRVLGRLSLDIRLSRSLRLRPRATAFRFQHTTQEGYFAPDEYALAEVGLGADRYRGDWSFSGEVAPGMQRIGSAGDVKGALSGRGRLAYTLAPGREVGVSFAFSNLGMERFQAGATGYRYQAAVISAAWGF
jgi:tetratricopeptide (TPR) repeat protein